MYFLRYQGQNHGPYALDQIQSMWGSGLITADAVYWAAAENAWKPVAELLPRGQPEGIAQEQPQPSDTPSTLSDDSSRVRRLLLLPEPQRRRAASWAKTRKEGKTHFAIKWGIFIWGWTVLLCWVAYRFCIDRVLERQNIYATLGEVSAVVPGIFFAGYRLARQFWDRQEKWFLKVTSEGVQDATSSMEQRGKNRRTLINVAMLAIVVFFITYFVGYFVRFGEIPFTKHGTELAQTAVGNAYYSGHAVQSNSAEVVKKYRRSAEEGRADAQFALGNAYRTGAGVENDPTEAVKWYRKAAEQGHAEAQFSLGASYEEASGVIQDHIESAKWFLKAAAQGHTFAQINLGACYFSGEGVEQNHAEAYAWWNLAAKTDKNAAERRDFLERKMTPERLAEAQRRARELQTQMTSAK